MGEGGFGDGAKEVGELDDQEDSKDEGDGEGENQGFELVVTVGIAVEEGGNGTGSGEVLEGKGENDDEAGGVDSAREFCQEVGKLPMEKVLDGEIKSQVALAEKGDHEESDGKSDN